LTCYCSTCGTPSLLVGGITIYVDANAPPPVPVIASFTPNPATVVPGYSTTLSWSVQGATTLQVTPTLGTVTGTSATVAPASTTTYQLTATNVTGSTSATATVIVAGTGVPVWKRDIIYLGGVAIAEIDANGLHELHCDALGTPRLITNAAGVVEGAQTFGPYGETLSAWGYAPITGYTGHLQAEPSGLIYMRGRFYSPAWHRFLNGDQGVDPNQMNQFAYVGGRPFAGVDPSGMLALSPEQAKLGNYIANAKAYDSLDGPNLPDLYFMLTMANQNPLLLPSQLSNLATVAQWAPASTIDAVDEFGNNASYEQPGFWYFAVQSQTNQGLQPGACPPIPVPGAPDLPWGWNPNPQNPRGGTWGPRGWKGPNPPSGSWDPDGHWDIDPGRGEPRGHVDPFGNPLTPEEAHPGSGFSNPWAYGAAAVGVGILIVVTDGAAAPLVLAF